MLSPRGCWRQVENEKPKSSRTKKVEVVAASDAAALIARSPAATALRSTALARQV